MDADVAAHMMRPPRKPLIDRDLRDAVLFVVGLVGVLHEIFFTGPERPTLLLLFAAMMGLPFLLRANGR